MFTIQDGYTFTCCSIIADKSLIRLVAVKFNHVNEPTVRAPRYIGKISVCRVTGIKINSLAALHIIHSDSNLMPCFARHRIFLWCQSSYACIDVHFGIVGNHRLVHPVKSQFITIAVPEGPFIYAELVAIHALSVNDIAAAVCCQLPAVAFCVIYEEVIVLNKSHAAACARPVGSCLILTWLAPYDFL